MNKSNAKNRFSIIWGSCLFVFLISMIVGFSISFKGTNAYFGDPSYGTGSLGGEIYSVFYYRNWPDIDDVEVIENKKYNITKVISYDELFTVLDGYRFIGWNSKRDGSGISYDVEYVFKLTANINLYAQWRLIVAYGDVNEDGIINEDDYLLIEKYLNNEDVLTDGAKINADVNNDDQINLVDVDIIKQVCLGTVGYVGYLPSKPILIYDIYEGNIDIGTGDENDSNNDVDEDNNNEKDDSTGNQDIIDGNNGVGQTGTGSDSSGSGFGGASSNGGASNDNSFNVDNSTDNINDEINEDDSSDSNQGDNKVEDKFKFKFMNGNLEYFSSECLINDGECLLILPKDSPKIDGYRFTGWSEEKGCLDNKGIIKSVYVDSDKIYYACFVDNKSKSNIYLCIIILSICIVAIKLIWNLVSDFKKNSNIDSSK